MLAYANNPSFLDVVWWIIIILSLWVIWIFAVIGAASARQT
jgi:hypothetical protein